MAAALSMSVHVSLNHALENLCWININHDGSTKQLTNIVLTN